jgi:ATP-binding cassette subfamily C protein LapB
LSAALQQISYVLLVAMGAQSVSKGELTMGALIACSILSGRVLSPISSIPSQLVSWAQVKAAMKGLDRLWSLERDHEGVDAPVLLRRIQGRFQFDQVAAGYGAGMALEIPSLTIEAGQKIGVVGPIGSGKTTLLRLMSGMYKPQQGRVTLDDVDLAHISKPILAENVGYLQQEGRLFAGTLKDNLILGMIDPGDEDIIELSKHTGLFDAVISQREKGLQQEIFEGGTGLSGGQRQLVNLTRVFLRAPKVWLLDEPTASMDRRHEAKVIEAMQKALRPEDTLVVVTHKLEMLALVDRVLVVADHKIVMDGPKEQVLANLQ